MKLIIGLIFACFIISCCNSPDYPYGSYAGSQLPKDSALLFAPDFINTGMLTRDIAFTPDTNEIYFTVMVGNFQHAHILFTKRKSGYWTMPEVANFANNPKYKYLEPFISPDGENFFFVSNQAESTNDTILDENIWLLKRKNLQWEEPKLLSKKINSIHSEFFPSAAENGTLYFTREEPDGSFIYSSELRNGDYQNPKKLPEQINAGRTRFNATISKNDSMLIVPTFGLEDSFGRTDYYISFKNKNGNWSNLINMGSQVNSESGQEYSANWSPDGKYLFFMSSKTKQSNSPIINFEQLQKIYLRAENGKANIYWIKSDFINQLREKATYN